MSFGTYLSILLILAAWMTDTNSGGGVSACDDICEENDGGYLECIHSTDGEQYMLRFFKEEHILQIQCEESTRSLNFSNVENCSFPVIVQVEISGCPLPNETFGDILYQMGLDPQNVTSFGFFNRSEDLELLEQWHLEGLSHLTDLALVNSHFRTIPERFFLPTPNLKSLLVISNYISSLPESLFYYTPDIEYVNFENNGLDYMPNSLFYNLSNLVTVNFSQNFILDLPSDIFMDNINLKVIDFRYNQITEMDPGIFRNISSLEELYLQGNLLTTLPNFIFDELISLRSLDLSSNNLMKLSNKLCYRARNIRSINLKNNSLNELPGEVFKHCGDLEKLDLSYNNLENIKSSMFPRPETNLKHIDLSHNSLSFTGKVNKILTTTFVTHEDDFPLSRQTLLEKILLNDNAINSIPHAFHRLFTKLELLDLSGNAIEMIHFGSLLLQQNSVTLKLQNNDLKLIDFHDIYPIIHEKKVNLYLSGNDNLQCNCRLYRFARIVQGLPIGASISKLIIAVEDSDNVYCKNQQEELEVVSKVNTKLLTCKLPEAQCIGNCTCLWREFDEMFIIDCSYQGLQELPKLPNFNLNRNISVALQLQNNSISSLNGLQDVEYTRVVNLSLANNMISAFNESEIPKTLKILDVRGNNLTFVPETLLEVFNATDMTISLGNNPWICDCDLINFLNFLQVPLRKVKDFDDIRCTGSNDLLVEMTEYSLCPFFMQPMVIITIVAIAGFLLLFAVLGTVSFYKYNQGIKVWLYAHRMCLWAITEDELDADKKYDAFISYSHKDEEFVNTVLVPGLESGDPKYRICLHYRDWIPGEYIQNQILQSVEASRRTIVILSSNFIESVWGQLEFKAAHSQALQDKTNRIIVIVYGKIPPTNELDEKLRLYISTNTYLKWGDTKFWEKLRYVMPHPQSIVRNKTRKRKDTDKLELVKSNSKGSA